MARSRSVTVGTSSTSSVSPLELVVTLIDIVLQLLTLPESSTVPPMAHRLLTLDRVAVGINARHSREALALGLTLPHQRQSGSAHAGDLNEDDQSAHNTACEKANCNLSDRVFDVNEIKRRKNHRDVE